MAPSIMHTQNPESTDVTGTHLVYTTLFCQERTQQSIPPATILSFISCLTTTLNHFVLVYPTNEITLS